MPSGSVMRQPESDILKIEYKIRKETFGINKKIQLLIFRNIHKSRYRTKVRLRNFLIMRVMRIAESLKIVFIQD